MKLFSRLYVLVMQWARHKHAPWYLSITAFIESVFWPIPVDVMLAPMALAKPHKAWHYAGLATFFSVLGALFGYALGYALWEPVVQPLVVSVGYEDKIALAEQWFAQQPASTAMRRPSSSNTQPDLILRALLAGPPVQAPLDTPHTLAGLRTVALDPMYQLK